MKAFENTYKYWREKDITYHSPFKKLVRTSYGVLLGVIYSPTSAPVASPTTSLPEVVGGKRN